MLQRQLFYQFFLVILILSLLNRRLFSPSNSTRRSISLFFTALWCTTDPKRAAFFTSWRLKIITIVFFIFFKYVCGSINLDCRIVHLDFNREKLDALKQKYGGEVDIYDPGLYGCVLVSSNSISITSRQMLQEFKKLIFFQVILFQNKLKKNY